MLQGCRAEPGPTAAAPHSAAGPSLLPAAAPAPDGALIPTAACPAIFRCSSSCHPYPFLILTRTSHSFLNSAASPTRTSPQARTASGPPSHCPCLPVAQDHIRKGPRAGPVGRTPWVSPCVTGKAAYPWAPESQWSRASRQASGSPSGPSGLREKGFATTLPPPSPLYEEMPYYFSRHHDLIITSSYTNYKTSISVLTGVTTAKFFSII